MNGNDDTLNLRKPIRRSRFVIGCALAVLAAGSIVRAQTNDKKAPAPPSAEPPTAKTHPNDPLIWDEEQMMEEAVIQITRHYNLTKAQENYTRLFLKTKVRAFLEEHDMAIRELLMESINLRRHPDQATPERLMDWALRAAPVYEAAKKAILDGNATWRDILDEDQIKIHDRDLRLMTANFSNVTDKLETWKRGEGNLPAAARQAPRTIATGPGKISQGSGGQIVRSVKMEDQWAAFVSRFIHVYHLDEAQQNAAREGILKEQLSKAAHYRDQKKSAFLEIQEKMSLKGSKKDQKERIRILTNLNRRRRALERPLHVLFVEMNDRLNILPRSEQKANLDQERKEELDRLYRTLAGVENKNAKSTETPAAPKAGPSKSPPTAEADPKKDPDNPAASKHSGDPAGQKGSDRNKDDAQAASKPKPAGGADNKPAVKPKSNPKPAPGRS